MNQFFNILKFSIFTLFIFLGTETNAFVNYDEWEGDVDRNWNNPNNWEGDDFPTSGQAARIDPSNYDSLPLIDTNSAFSPRYLVVQGGGTLEINADFNCGRDMYVAGGSQVIINSGTVSNGPAGNRNLNIRNEDTKVIVNGGVLNIDDDLYLDRFLDLLPGADPTLEVNGGRVIFGGDVRFDGVFAEKPTLELNGGTVVVNGDLYNDGADVTIVVSGDSLIINGDFIMDGAGDSLLMSGGVIQFVNDAGTMTVDGIYDCTGGSSVFEEDYTLDGSGNVIFHELDVTSPAGGLDQQIAQITINGGVSISGTFIPNTNSVILNGASTQLLLGTGGIDFYDLEIDNSSSFGIGLFIDINITSGGTLTLTDGILHSDSNNTLTLSHNTSTTGGSSASYVDNYMRKIGDADYIFPLGDQGVYSQIEISGATGTDTTDVFEASYGRGVHPNAFWDSLTYLGDPGGMYNVSILDYWKLYRTNGIAEPFVKLYWESGDSAQIDNLTDLVVAHYTGSNTWENLGGTTSGTVASGSVETSARVTSFSPFTFGSSSSTSNPLPITLLKFSAKADDEVVVVNWTTIEEINNDYFEVEVSLDGIHFSAISKIRGAGNHSGKLNYAYIDDSPFRNGYSYYRLSQTDYDGSKTYSTIESVYLKDKGPVFDMKIFPNPSRDGEVTLHIPKLSEKSVDIEIYDIQGNLISTKVCSFTSSGITKIKTPTKQGLYIVSVLSDSSILNQRLLIQ